MRGLLALLIVANLLAFAVFQGWLSPWFHAEREPQRLVEQRSPERLRVVPLQRLRPAPGSSPAPSAPSAPASPAASQPSPAPAPGPAPGTVAAASSVALVPGAAAAPPAEVCVAFVTSDEQRGTRLREALEAGGARVVATRFEQPSAYLVYAPPAPTRADAQLRLAELRAAGQDDVFVIQDGSLRFAISVGLFRSEEVARALVMRLRERGQTDLRIKDHGPVTSRLQLQARWPDAAAASAAAAIGRRFDLTPRDCG